MSGMIGLDTNVIVRYIMQDDPKQSELATRAIESLTPESPGYVSLVALVQLIWVLSSVYHLTRAQVVEVLDGLLRTKEILVEQAEAVWTAVHVYRESNADFADCLIERVASAAGCVRTITFDLRASKHAGMTLLR